MNGRPRLALVVLVAAQLVAGVPRQAAAQAMPEGEMRWIDPSPWSAPVDDVRLRKR